MFSLSSYFSVEYMLILLPLSVGLYLILPQKLRRISLLLCSYAFFWAVSGKLIVYLLISTLLVYLFGLWLGRIQDELAQALAVWEKGGKRQSGHSIRQGFSGFVCWGSCFTSESSSG